MSFIYILDIMMHHYLRSSVETSLWRRLYFLCPIISKRTSLNKTSKKKKNTHNTTSHIVLYIYTYTCMHYHKSAPTLHSTFKLSSIN